MSDDLLRNVQVNTQIRLLQLFLSCVIRNKKKQCDFFFFFSCRQNQTIVQQWKIAVNFILNFPTVLCVCMCVTGGIMLSGAAPTCMFPHSGIPPSSRDHPTRLDRDYRRSGEKERRKQNERGKGKPSSFPYILSDWTDGVTFHICKGWGVSSPPLLGGARGWRSSRPPAARHWDRKRSSPSQEAAHWEQHT